MVFFKRLSRSRSRSNSQSYVDRYEEDNNSSGQNNRAASYDEKYGGTPTDEPRDNPIPRAYSESNMNNTNNAGAGMYANNGRRPQPQHPDQYSSPTATTSQYASGRQQPPSNINTNGYGSYDNAKAASTPTTEPAPDLLLQAFNQALRPYSDKIDGLEGEIADLKAYIDALERQRSEVHAWIDKRGLRPGQYIPSPASHFEVKLTSVLCRCPTFHCTNHGRRLSRLLANPRRGDTERSARPQDHNR